MPLTLSALARSSCGESIRDLLMQSVLSVHPRGKPVEPFIETRARCSGRLDDFDFRMNTPRILARELRLERYVRQQIDFVQNHQLRFTKDAGVLQRLVFAFRDAEHNHLRVFAEIVAGGADQVTYVLDKQEIERLEIPSLQVFLYHAGVEMACSGGGDLPDWIAVPPQPDRIVLGLNVSGEDGRARRRSQLLQRALEESSLACSRGADEVQR